MSPRKNENKNPFPKYLYYIIKYNFQIEINFKISKKSILKEKIDDFLIL